MSSQGIMSGKKADNNPGLCPVMKQKSGLCNQTGAQKQFLSLFLNTTRSTLLLSNADYPPSVLSVFLYSAVETPRDGTDPTNF
jgi:hypothetical protein